MIICSLGRNVIFNGIFYAPILAAGW